MILSERRATADRRQIVHPPLADQRQRQLPTVIQQVNEVTAAQHLETKSLRHIQPSAAFPSASYNCARRLHW